MLPMLRHIGGIVRERIEVWCEEHPRLAWAVGIAVAGVLLSRLLDDRIA